MKLRTVFVVTCTLTLIGVYIVLYSSISNNRQNFGLGEIKIPVLPNTNVLEEYFATNFEDFANNQNNLVGFLIDISPNEFHNENTLAAAKMALKNATFPTKIIFRIQKDKEFLQTPGCDYLSKDFTYFFYLDNSDRLITIDLKMWLLIFREFMANNKYQFLSLRPPNDGRLIQRPASIVKSQAVPNVALSVFVGAKLKSYEMLCTAVKQCLNVDLDFQFCINEILLEEKEKKNNLYLDPSFQDEVSDEMSETFIRLETVNARRRSISADLLSDRIQQKYFIPMKQRMLQNGTRSGSQLKVIIFSPC